MNPVTIKYENEKLLLQDKYLTIKNSNITAKVSKNQRVLILCLMNEIIEKDKIIQNIWGVSDTSSKEKNYNQLVFQTRSLLARQGFPNDLIMTIHRYGLCFNKFFLTNHSSTDDYWSEKSSIPMIENSVVSYMK